MSVLVMNVPATLQPDGLTLRLDEKLPLPSGRVNVTIRPAEPVTGPTMLEVLERIHRDRHRRRAAAVERTRNGRRH